MMGASCVQLASVIMERGYGAITEIIRDLENWMTSHNCRALSEIRGAALSSLCPFEDLQPQPLTAGLSSPCSRDCSLCQDGCIYGAVGRDKNNAVVIDETRCTGCGFCVARCPDKKIALKW